MLLKKPAIIYIYIYIYIPEKRIIYREKRKQHVKRETTLIQRGQQNKTSQNQPKPANEMIKLKSTLNEKVNTNTQALSKKLNNNFPVEQQKIKIN